MSKSKIFLTLYGAFSVVYINLIGRLMLAELIALLTLPFINIRKLLGHYKGLRVILASLTVLLLVQMLSDFINNSSPTDYLRGWALIVFSMISTIFFVKYLSKNTNNIVYYLFASMVALMIFGQGEFDISILKEDTNYFKIRFVGFLNLAILLMGYFLYKKKKDYLSSSLFIIYGLFCMVMDARATGLIFIISGILLYVKSSRIRLTFTKILMIGVLQLGILYAGYVYYVDQVLYHDFGGQNAKIQLNEASNPYNPFELLYYGRTETIILMQAGLDKPILGYGSWGKDPGGKYALMHEKLIDRTLKGHSYIYAHSIVFGYFAYAGILGLIAISFLFFKLISYTLKIYRSDIRITVLPIIIVLSIFMLWDFFFSPIQHLRLTFPITAALIIVTYEQIKLNKFKYIRGKKR